ncbi:hypothetical protein C2I27_03280 [Priestia megaterium]|nr:hypothetical protein C2I27_03280 [Priestia megaterium]
MILSKMKTISVSVSMKFKKKEAEITSSWRNTKKHLCWTMKKKSSMLQRNISNLTQARSEAIQLAQDEKGTKPITFFSKQIVTLRTTINNTLDDFKR